MCIGCNTNHRDVAYDYLREICIAIEHMKKAEKFILECSKIAYKPEVRKQYDKVHKMLVKKRKEWAKVDEIRELKSYDQNL